MAAAHPSAIIDDSRLGAYSSKVGAALERMSRERVPERLIGRDHTLWSPSPDEIENRLGWLDLPDAMAGHVASLRAFAEEVSSAGITHAVLLGMGGSSLAPEVFAHTFGVAEGHPALSVLDTTHPDAVRALETRLDLGRTLFIVSSKSGTTIETLSLFKYFFSRVHEAAGAKDTGAHFAAITDPGSSLEALGRSLRFRAVFLADPDVGGRYSALSHFGLVPAALIGVDLERLLASARDAARACETPATEANPGARLGAALGALANAGRDKATFVASPVIARFGDWVEQLIAESTGKRGRGILPVVGEALGPPDLYGGDRAFFELRLREETPGGTPLDTLARAGHPVVSLGLEDVYDLGAQMYLWEYATAIAGHLMGIHPFDQPDVEAAKVLAREAIEAYRLHGALPDGPRSATVGDVEIHGSAAPSPRTALDDLLQAARPGGYVALQAYVNPTTEMDAALQTLRRHIRARTRLAVTVGYGPRFLHSTGQLHKGDAGSGLFVQVLGVPVSDMAVPEAAGSAEQSFTFGVLTEAEARGDRDALTERGRRVLALKAHGDVVEAIHALHG